MNSRPLSLPPAQRARLREFERLHEEWRNVVAAADALGCPLQGPEQVQQLLEYRLAADRVCQRTMELLHESPL